MILNFAQTGYLLRRSSPLEALPEAPDYASLSNIEGIWDSTGLVANTTNSYGVVGATNQRLLTSWKSIAPGPTGRDFTTAGTAGNISMTMVNGVPVIDNLGAGLLRHASGAATWNYRHYNATFANLKWTETFCLRAGFGSNPNAAYGVIGNNGGSQGAKGASFFFDDRVAVPASNRMTHQITKGTAGFISTCTTDDVATFNEWGILTLVFDGSLTAANRFKAYWNGVQVTLTVTSASTAVVTTPTYDLELFATGNGALPMNGQMSHVILQSGVASTEVRQAFEDSLIPWKNYLNRTDSTPWGDKYHIYDDLAETGNYYLSTSLCQNPTNLDTIVMIFADGTAHTGDSTKKLSIRKSTDRGKTFATKTDVYDPLSTLQVQDMGAGYSANGRLHVIVDVHTNNAGTIDDPHSLIYLYSDDDGTSWTTVDLTSLLPSDSLATFRVYTNIIENNGVLMFPMYKQADEGVTTSSANYLFRSTDGGANWSVITIRASGGTYINEPTIIALNSTKLIVIARNEATKEYTLFESNDNGLTWSTVGDLSFGEAFGTAGPARLNKFTENGTEYVVCYYPDRQNKLLKAIYAKTSDLITSSSDFDTATKTTLVSDHFHYGSVCHPWGDRSAIGSYANEPTTVTLTENNLTTFYVPTYHIDGVITTLG